MIYFSLVAIFYLNFARVGGSHIRINFHEEPPGIIKLDASSREAGQNSGINIHLILYRLKKEKPLPAGNGLVENLIRIFSTCSLRWNYPDQVPRV
jgi:hypothetical protein